jgi:putative transposase
MKNNRKPYDTDITENEWELIKHFFKRQTQKWEKRELLNAVFYVLKTGCQWRSLPHDFPPVFTVWSFYRRALLTGLFDRINVKLVKINRTKSHRNEYPSFGIVDSQSVRTSNAHKELTGIDGGKKIKGRKRHIVVDSLGNILSCVIHPANQADTTTGIMPVLQAFESFPTLQAVGVDLGYRGTFEKDVKNSLNIPVKLSAQIKPKGFVVQPIRWHVEQAFGLMKYRRRLSKDYELSNSSARGFVILHSIKQQLHRITI